MGVPNSSFTRNLNVVKMYFRKPMALIISILSLATLLANFLVNSKAKEFSDSIVEFLQKYGSEQNANVEISAGSSDNVLGFLISGVCIACFFMIYLFSSTPNGNPTIFFATLHILSVIQLILSALASLLIVIFGLVSILSINSFIVAILLLQSSHNNRILIDLLKV